MELDSNQILLDLVKGQAQTQTMVKDMSDRLFGTSGQPGVLITMHQEHKKDQDELATRITSVEKKVWYATGFGAAIGAVASLIGFKIHH